MPAMEWVAMPLEVFAEFLSCVGAFVEGVERERGGAVEA